jgi:hypothetical protein
MTDAPEFLERMVSSAVPVLRLRMIDDDLRLYKASSNICAVLESKILLLRPDYVQNADVLASQITNKLAATYVVEPATGNIVLEFLDQLFNLVTSEVVNVRRRV